MEIKYLLQTISFGMFIIVPFSPTELHVNISAIKSDWIIIENIIRVAVTFVSFWRNKIIATKLLILHKYLLIYAIKSERILIENTLSKFSIECNQCLKGIKICPQWEGSESKNFVKQ